MKQCWISLKSWNKKIVTESLESGVDAVICHSELVPKIRELGRIRIISDDKSADMIIPDDVEIITIRDKNDENRASVSLKSKITAVRLTDWNIIPIENLIPNAGDRLFTFVKNIEEAKLAAEIMEKGVSGIILETEDPSEIAPVAKYIKQIGSEKFYLGIFKITQIKNIGIGDRVCIDTCSNLNISEGMLVGNSNSGMFLVHAENIENPYVAPRPFRVNAGAVHAYVMVPDGKTRYLGELSTGDPILIVNKNGETYAAFVGRSKIEKRPMLVIYANDKDGNEHTVILQNAETIRLTHPDGEAVSVAALQIGDEVLGYAEKGGRHFGMKVEETISEK
jgi:3-dehydroquinate synthase II